MGGASAGGVVQLLPNGRWSGTPAGGIDGMGTRLGRDTSYVT